MIAYFARLGMVTTSLWRRQEAEPLSSRHSWAAFIVLIGSLTVSPSSTAFRNILAQVTDFLLLPSLRKALMSATLIPTLQPRTPVRLQARTKSSTSLAADSSSSTTTTFQSADPLEPLANLSLSRNGSLLVPSPPTTPTPTGTGTTRRKQSATIREQPPLSTEKSRSGSFSLGLRSWTRSSPSPLGVAAASTRPTDDAATPLVDDEEENVDDAGESSMDWCPTPPPGSTSTSSAFANRANSYDSPSSSARFSTNHVTFARQRFVPPDTRTPTGLEGMFARVVAVRDDGASAVLSGGTVPVVAGRDVEMKSVAQSTTGGGSSTWGLARWWGK